MSKSYLLISSLLLFFISSNEEVIDLRGKQLSEIPASIFKHRKLQELHLGFDTYVSYPPLTLLVDGEISLQEIPSQIGKLKQLKRLTISSTQISQLPISFRKLQQLHYLNLSFNKSLDLSSEVNTLNSLATLDTLVCYGMSLSEDSRQQLLQQNTDLVILDNQSLVQPKNKN